ncbi:MAG: glycosyltransferase family 2 protein [Tissierellia bacterium]|nr:glycosyltransferase family 2 protein [Tissierellia bacterium]
MEKPQISVIVTIFNSEKYLRRCIDSILSQTFKKFELILVNDGSTDSSEGICNVYSKEDNRIKVINKENGGVSSSRNTGICNATGLYSIFVDSDDYIDVNMLQRLYDEAIIMNSEMVICDYWIGNDDNFKRINQGGFKNNNDFISKLLTGELHGSVCNKLISTSLYKDNAIKFPEDLSIKEDLFVCISLLLKNIKVNYLNEAYYYYCNNIKSLTNESGNNQMIKQYESSLAIISLFKNNSIFKNQINSFKLRTRMNIFVLSNNKGLEIRDVFPETNKYLLKENKIPLLLRIGMKSAISGKGLIANLLLQLRLKCI